MQTYLIVFPEKTLFNLCAAGEDLISNIFTAVLYNLLYNVYKYHWERTKFNKSLKRFDKISTI